MQRQEFLTCENILGFRDTEPGSALRLVCNYAEIQKGGKIPA